MEFLSKKFKNGASHGTLNTARSAISLISSNKISSDPLFSRFFKGVCKERPIKPKYSTTWDTQPVLSFLEEFQPWKNLKANGISEKTVTLLALVTAHCLRTLALIIISNITVTSTNQNTRFD